MRDREEYYEKETEYIEDSRYGEARYRKEDTVKKETEKKTHRRRDRKEEFYRE